MLQKPKLFLVQQEALETLISKAETELPEQITVKLWHPITWLITIWFYPIAWLFNMAIRWWLTRSDWWSDPYNLLFTNYTLYSWDPIKKTFYKSYGEVEIRNNRDSKYYPIVDPLEALSVFHLLKTHKQNIDRQILSAYKAQKMILPSDPTNKEGAIALLPTYAPNCTPEYYHELEADFIAASSFYKKELSSNRELIKAEEEVEKYLSYTLEERQ
jgi:hypothetical protein